MRRHPDDEPPFDDPPVCVDVDGRDVQGFIVVYGPGTGYEALMLVHRDADGELTLALSLPPKSRPPCAS